MSTRWSSLLLEVSPFTGSRGDLGNGANRNLTLLWLPVLSGYAEVLLVELDMGIVLLL